MAEIEIISMNICILLCIVFFFEKRTQIPIAPNMIKTDKKAKLLSIVVVACSATESVNGSWDTNNGLTELRYLNPGRPTWPLNKTPMPEMIMPIKRKKAFRSFVASLLNFFMISAMITNNVGKSNANPA